MGELMAAVYDPLIAPLDPVGVRRWRQWVVSAAHGHVLEVGVGTGLNLPYYPAVESVAAIDPDGASLRRAFSRSERRGLTVSFYQASAEDLPFADRSFDVVLSTLVFCSIGDPERALREVRRVLKNGGTFRVIEHVRVGNGLIAGVQDRVTPLWKQVTGGCHLNRDTLRAIQDAGFHVNRVRRHIGGLFVGIDATNLLLPAAAPSAEGRSDKNLGRSLNEASGSSLRYDR
jgi:ubiquinone/menaquinone biosynthesis C-methylase UbiE